MSFIALKIATHFHRLGWRASDMDDSREVRHITFYEVTF